MVSWLYAQVQRYLSLRSSIKNCIVIVLSMKHKHFYKVEKWLVFPKETLSENPIVGVRK